MNLQESIPLKVMLVFEWFPGFAMINTIYKLAYSPSWCSKMKVKFKHILDGQQQWHYEGGNECIYGCV